MSDGGRRVEGPLRRGSTAAVLVAAGLVVVGAVLAGSGRPVGHGPHPDADGSPTPARAEASGAPSVTVADRAGSSFVVQAMPVVETVAVNTDGFLWSAAPGQEFMADELTVTNPTRRDEPMSDFDDLVSGLADDLELVTPASDVGSSRFASACGAEPGFLPSLCPISYGQGLTVDTDSVDHDDHVAALELAPGSSAQITVSYGPVPDDVTTASLYFVGGASSPVDLTP